MKPYALLFALAVVPVASLLGTGDSQAAQGAGCKASRWSLSLPQGQASAESVIIDVPENKVWRVSAGRVPANATLVIEYRSTIGTTGEVALDSGGAQLVEGSSVTMRLIRGQAKGAQLAVGGSYQIKCK